MPPHDVRFLRLARFSTAVVLLALFGSACGSESTTRNRNAALGAVVSQDFVTGEDREFVVPEGITSIDISLSGAQGGVRTADESVGSGTGGRGGFVSGKIAVTPGETLTVQVGQKGPDESWQGAYPDGGSGGYPGPVYNPKNYLEWFYMWQHQGSGGGGSSRIWRGDQLIAIAGGGGGAGERSNGGDGGVTGGDADARYGGGGGATQSEGGAAGCTPTDFDGTKVCAVPGTYLAGAPGEIAGSGGGGGYYGGGAGSAVFYAGSGGGGSSWAREDAFTGDVTYRSGTQSGDGVVTISYFDPTAESKPTLPPTTTTEPPPVAPCQWGGPCTIGDTGPGGGVVIFNGSNPWNGPNSGPYLEVSNDAFRLPWCENQNTVVPGANDSTIGGGRNNQEAILKVCNSGAARWVDSATWGGKTDWWLPNDTELNLLSMFWRTMFYRYAWTDPAAYARWRDWGPVTCGGVINTSWAWSSSQISAGQATIMYVPSGSVERGDKGDSRCSFGVRMFQYGDSSPLPMPTTTTTSSTSTTTTEAPTTSTTTAPTTTSTSTTTTGTPATSTTAVPTTSTAIRATTSTVAPSPTVVSAGATSVPGVPTTSRQTQSSEVVSAQAQATTTTMTPIVSVPRTQLLSEIARDNITPPAATAAAPVRYADWVEVPKDPVAATAGSASVGATDTAQNPEVGEFSVEQVTVRGSKTPYFRVGIRLPKRAAKTISYALRVNGQQGQPGGVCTVVFRNSATAAPKYSMRATCKGSQKLVLAKPKKSFGANERIYFQWAAAPGTSSLEVRSVVKGVKGTPTTGIWRSRWLTAQ